MEDGMLKIDKTADEGKVTFTLEGRLDTLTAPDLEKKIMDSIDGISELIIDFKGVDYISSAGLRVLLSSLKLMNKQGSMKVVNVCEAVMEIFEVTGFTDILTIE